MKLSNAAWLAFLLALCAACSSRSTYLPQPVAIAAEGAYTHQASGMTFAETLPDFRRNSVQRADTDGLAVSADYESTSGGAPIAATVGIFPSPRITTLFSSPDSIALSRALTAQEVFKQLKKEFHTAHPQAKWLRQRKFASPAAAPLLGRMAVYALEGELAGQRQELRAELYLFSYVRDKWEIRYRFLYPSGFDAGPQIAQFICAVPTNGAWATPAGCADALRHHAAASQP